MSVMRRQQEEDNGHRSKEFLRGCVLIAIVHLLPHVKVVECTGVELERYALNVVEHKVRRL